MEHKALLGEVSRSVQSVRGEVQGIRVLGWVTGEAQAGEFLD